MAILDYEISTTGLISNVSGQGAQASQLPVFIYITTNDTLANVLVTGYLNELKQTYQVPFSNFQMALVYTTDSGPVILRVFIVGKNYSLENPSVSGSVFGPGSSTNNALARWSGTTGTQLLNSGAILDNSNNLTINSLTLTVPLAFTYGGTGLSTIAQGSILYSAVANSISELLKDTNASRYLSNQGAFNAPLWAQVDLTNGVTGNLPVTNLNSGTGASASTFWRGDATWGTLVSSISGTANQIIASASTGGVTISIAPNAILPGTGGVQLPGGTTAQRAGAAGTIRFNSQVGVFETTSNGSSWDTIETSAIGVVSVSGTINRITASPTTGNVVVDISASYTGQNTITTVGTISAGVWGNGATPIGTTSGGTNITFYALGDTLYASGFNILSKLQGNITSSIRYLSQTGTGAASAAPAWATISGADISGAALTKTDDTNVTLTLGGTPNTALLRAASLTLGWSGQLGLTRGGTAASLTADNGGIVYSTASALAILASTVTAGQMLRSGASAAPTWSTTTWPASTAQGDVLYSSAANVISGLTKDTNATRYLSNTGTSNNPAWAQINLANGVTGILTGTNGGTGINNGASTFTIGGNTAFSGAFTFTGTLTANTSVTFPVSGTLSTNGVSGRNMVVNGDFQIAQRGAGGAASFASGPAPVYTIDRWQLKVNVSQASTVTQTAGTASGSFVATVQRNSGQTGTGTILFCTSLTRDMCVGAAGQPVTVTFNAKCGADYSPTSSALGLTVYSGTGTTDISGINGAFSGTANAISQTLTLTTSFQTFTFTSSALGSTVSQLAVQFSMTPTGTAGTVDSFIIQDVALVIGSASTAYTRLNFQEALSNCQRFYFKTFAYGTAPAQNVGINTGERIMAATVTGAMQNNQPSADFPVLMRATPTITTFNPANTNAQARDESANADCSSTGSNLVSARGFNVFFTGNAGTFVNDVIGLHITADCDVT